MDDAPCRCMNILFWWHEYPRKMHLVGRGERLSQCGWKLWTKQTQPQTLGCKLWKDWDADKQEKKEFYFLKQNWACDWASNKQSLGHQASKTFIVVNKHLVITRRCRCFLSATPFRWGMRGQEVSWWIPLDCSRDKNWLDLNSRALLDLKNSRKLGFYFI